MEESAARVGRLRQLSASVSRVSRGVVVCLRSRGGGEGVYVGFLERRVGRYWSLELGFVSRELWEMVIGYLIFRRSVERSGFNNVAMF